MQLQAFCGASANNAHIEALIAAHDLNPDAHRIIVEMLYSALSDCHAEFLASQALQDAEIKLLRDTLIVSMENRHLYMVGDLSTIELREGVYNAALARIEC